MGHLGPKGAPKVGPKTAHLRGYINRGVDSAAPPVCQVRGRLRGPSSPDRDASSRTCGYLGGAASAAQGRAAREEDLATALPTFICTTPTRYRSFAPARLVVIP